MLTTFLDFKTITSSLSKTLARTAAEPQVARESAQYLAAIGTVKTVDDFLNQDRVFRFAMKAYGLGEMAYAKGFMRKLLQDGVDDPSALVNRLADPRYKIFVKAFNFARYGTLTTTSAATRQGTVDQYVRQMLEEKAGANNEGTRLALYFQRKAPEISSAYIILADPALLKVVQVTLDLSPATGRADIERQASLIEAKLKIGDLKDPAKLDKFLQRFASLYDAANETGAGQVSTVLSGPASFGLSADLLLRFQSIRR